MEQSQQQKLLSTSQRQAPTTVAPTAKPTVAPTTAKPTTKPKETTTMISQQTAQ